MRAWVLLAGFVLAAGWAVWAQRRMQRRVLAFLVRRTFGQPPGKGARLTHLVQGGAAVAAVAVLALAGWAEQVERWFWLRIPLALLVLLVYVPFAATLARIHLARVRRGSTPQARLQQMGATPGMAEAIARAGRPWAVVGSVVMIVAVLILAWHHLR
ncbi:hypothetical protein G9U51_06775 [Calidifontibacter sp. DB0510]|uniref:DUF2269 family protein n=1 Tax=Metallococcus carri TaxID=1656884 RepID=A0A967AYP1_9MICO|nr:hypothetical protein [Metallococcus carri]NHN55484.1 hypothetical protein [Metallococcus carri]NOP38332.1 hypothetical protein [Calidifontibacter sp. DB2511S]